MKIAIIGGGPAGLYFALLMQKKYPNYSIDLFERNGPNDTFGWGVVFSDKTLSYLREEDIPTYQEIVDSFATWDNVAIVHREETVRVGGNKFSGIARIEILHILQHRCAELGVELHFHSYVNDLAALSEYHLIVGADGINSQVRQLLESEFKPSISTRPNYYIWYGTSRLFPALTLTFRQNEHGVFAAHSYQFNDGLSTFIVECDPTTWQSAGFATKSDDETRDYLEKLFSTDLQGEKLLSNNSKWLNFLLVKNREWSYKNVVLLGDSLATVHFSIGSGTKLALEDAIALFHAFDGTTSVEHALRTFERERRPIVDQFQEAAYESLQFFENLKEYIQLDPIPFAYRIMTRSKRVDLENLRKRDPEFARAYEEYVQ